MIFIFFVAPRLPSGEFTQYYTVLTISLIIARLISCSAEEQYPLFVRGDFKKIQELSFLIYTLILISVLFFIFSFIIEYHFVLVVSFSITLISSAYIGGILRSYKPESYEVLINFPWLLFLFLSVVLKLNTYQSLILAVTFSQVLVQISIVAFHRIKTPSNEDANIRKLSISVKKTSLLGVRKTISSASQIMSTRGLILCSNFLSVKILGDSLAFSISIAEAVWQFFMVHVNRNYILYCKNDMSPQKVLKTSMFLFLMMCIFGVIFSVLWFFIGAWIQHNIVDIPVFVNDILPAFLILAFIIFFVNYRYYLWANNSSSLSVDVIFLAAFIFQGLTVYFSIIELWLIQTAVFCFLSVALFYFLNIYISRTK